MEEQAKKILPNLVQMSDIFKMIIPEEVESKIRFICQRIWDNEWSGVLFYTYEGNFEDKNLTIICKDIFVMDIGSRSYTEFDVSPDIATYMVDNPELLDCQMGLIHSHHNMSTFLSDTDTSTLKEEGNDRNNFVSLIVNNAGNYTAAITRKVKMHSVIDQNNSYNFFGEGEKTFNIVDRAEQEVIQYFDLTIEKPEKFTDLNARLDEITESKKQQVSTKYKGVLNYPFMNFTKKETKDTKKAKENKKKVDKPIQKTIFNEDYYDDYYCGYDYYDKPIFKDDKDLSNYNIPFDQVKLNPNTVKSIVAQIITGCVIINPKNLDLVKWVNSMEKVCERRFGKGDKGMKAFQAWAETYCEYLTWYVEDEDLVKQGLDDCEIMAICAYDVIEELEKFPRNKYLDMYIDALTKYVLE